MGGLTLMFLLILIGLGASSAFFRWKAPIVAREIDRQTSGLSTEPLARVDQWLKYGGPQVHNRLQFLRLSPRMPWLVSHVVESDDAAGPEIWGLDLAALPQDLARQDGMRIVVELPQPGLLGRGEPVGRERARDPALREPRRGAGCGRAHPDPGDVGALPSQRHAHGPGRGHSGRFVDRRGRARGQAVNESVEKPAAPSAPLRARTPTGNPGRVGGARLRPALSDQPPPRASSSCFPTTCRSSATWTRPARPVWCWGPWPTWGSTWSAPFAAGADEPGAPRR